MNAERGNGILRKKEGILLVRGLRGSAWTHPANQHQSLCVLSCLLMARNGTSLSFVILISKITIAPRDGRGPVIQVIPGPVIKRLAAGCGGGW